MTLHGLKALRLVFLCSVAVSCIQLLLYRTIVLNAKHLQDGDSPWKIQTYEESDIVNTSKQNVINNVTKTRKLTEIRQIPAEDVPELKVKADTAPDVKDGMEVIAEAKDVPGIKVKLGASHRTCSSHVAMSGYHQFSPITSNFSDWSYSKRRTCPNMKITESKSRLKFVVGCKNGEPFAEHISTFSPTDIQTFKPSDNCLRRFVEKCCSDSLPVPNVVHYMYYNRREFTFIDFVSFISVLRFVNPCVILIHGNVIPSGNYWNFILNLYPNIVHVFREVRQILFGQKIRSIDHFGDVWGIRALLRFGGIYLGTGTLLVKPIETLRLFPCTMARQSYNITKTIGSAFIMAERNSTFVRTWYDWYRSNYANGSFTYNAMVYPSILANRKPGLIHFEHGIVSRPDDQFRDNIFNTNKVWTHIYGLHLFLTSYRGNLRSIDENNVKTLNSTVGAICRHILYGNKELCFISP